MKRSFALVALLSLLSATAPALAGGETPAGGSGAPQTGSSDGSAPAKKHRGLHRHHHHHKRQKQQSQ